MEKRTYTVPEAARILGIGRNAGYEAVRTHQIPSIRIGKGSSMTKPITAVVPTTFRATRRVRAMPVAVCHLRPPNDVIERLDCSMNCHRLRRVDGLYGKEPFSAPSRLDGKLHLGVTVEFADNWQDWGGRLRSAASSLGRYPRQGGGVRFPSAGLREANTKAQVGGLTVRRAMRVPA